MVEIAVIFLFCLAGPLLLLPIESILPYPFIIEELFKVIIIYYIYNLTKKNIKLSIKYAFIGGLLFTISETIFYIPNFLIHGNTQDIPLRLLLTGTLHVSTFMILVPLFSLSYIGIFVGLISNGIYHYFFNVLMKEWFK